MCTLFLKLSTPILNTLKMNVFLWTDLKQADKDHYSDWSQHTEIELKAKLVSEWDQSNFLVSSFDITCKLLIIVD